MCSPALHNHPLVHDENEIALDDGVKAMGHLGGGRECYARSRYTALEVREKGGSVIRGIAIVGKDKCRRSYSVLDDTVGALGIPPRMFHTIFAITS